MSFGRPFQIALLAVLAGTAFAPATQGAMRAALLGVLLAAADGLAFHALAVLAWRRSNRTFLRATLGGMAVRLVVVPALAAALIWSLSLPVAPFAAALAATLVVFLVIETVVLHRLTGRRVAS